MMVRALGRRAVAGRIRVMSLGSRLALLGAAVTAAVVLVAFAVLRHSTEANVRNAFVVELGASQRVVQHVQTENQQLLLQTAALIANSPTLKAALDAGRSEGETAALRSTFIATVQHEADQLFGDLRQDFWVVADDSGRVIAAHGAAGAPAPGVSLLSMPVVHDALAPDSVTALRPGVHRQGNVALQVGAAPVIVHGLLVGVVVIGDAITMPQADSLMDIRGVVLAGDTVLASTLDQLHPGERVPTTWSGASGDRQVLELGGRQYVAARLTLGRADDGAPAALIMVRSLTLAVDPILRALTRRFLIIGVIAVLLVGIGATITTRLTLRPLSQFVAFMRAEAGGSEYAQFNQSNAAAEITLLTRAYNRLIASLQRGHEQLQLRTVELARVNDSLQRQVEERERAEEALRESEELLRQSQKLEALGSLAGGVAHDFNNILSIILGYAEIVQEELPAASSQRQDVAKISDAAMRARTLVRQLLAFSRKQVLQPQVLDLGEVVTNVHPLLRPLIGEDVSLRVLLQPGLAPMMADPGQIEQVLLNLVVNARDAMPQGGRILIETANVTLADGGSQQPLAGGPAVMLAVTDTGTGMDAATRSRIFEPFFTTKPVGKGTGLGLATVYGIVRQSEGNITVFSEPGKGTTFRCYFPAVIAGGPVTDKECAAAPTSRGAETILLVEDEDALRVLLRRALEGQGYAVLDAPNGSAALAVARAFSDPIHLLLTDVVMPELSGTELAAQLLLERPSTKVLFLSGYSAEAIDRHGVLSPDSMFLQKPVSPDALNRTVRDLLDDRIGAAAS